MVLEKKNAIICGVGNVAVWYNYSLFMPFFLILSSVFLPQASPFLKMIFGFTIFSLGLFTRPVGSYIFGKIGDRVSREKAIGYSVYLMAFSTVLIGVIPPYESIGMCATLLLIIARVAQGIAMGGAASISMVHLVELFPQNRKCLGGSLSQFGMILGITISNAVLASVPIFNNIFGEELGWRIAFLLGIVLIPFSRFNMSIKKTENVPVKKLSICEIVSVYRKEFLSVMALTAFASSCFYSLFAFLPNYMLSTYPMASTKILHIINFVMLVIIVFSGYLGDKIGKLKILKTGIYCAILGASFTLFISSGKFEVQMLMLTLCLAISIFYGCSSMFFSESFPKEVRCSAVALAMSLSQAIFGGLSPIISTTLIKYSFDFIIIPVIIVSILALIALNIMSNNHDKV